jgi:ATP-dependent Lon protease
VPFDLSKVVFITTANVLDSVPGPLRDRMEIIHLPGYTEEEKLEIAKRYLVKRQLEANGLKADQVQAGDALLAAIIRDYTREAGVRNLEREIGTIARKFARMVAEEAANGLPWERQVTAFLAEARLPRDGETHQQQAFPRAGLDAHRWHILFIEARAMRAPAA